MTDTKNLQVNTLLQLPSSSDSQVSSTPSSQKSRSANQLSFEDFLALLNTPQCFLFDLDETFLVNLKEKTTPAQSEWFMCLLGKKVLASMSPDNMITLTSCDKAWDKLSPTEINQLMKDSNFANSLSHTQVKALLCNEATKELDTLSAETKKLLDEYKQIRYDKKLESLKSFRLLFFDAFKPIMQWIVEHFELGFITAATYPKTYLTTTLKHAFELEFDEGNKKHFEYFNRSDIATDTDYLNFMEEQLAKCKSPTTAEAEHSESAFILSEKLEQNLMKLREAGLDKDQIHQYTIEQQLAIKCWQLLFLLNKPLFKEMKKVIFTDNHPGEVSSVNIGAFLKGSSSIQEFIPITALGMSEENSSHDARKLLKDFENPNEDELFEAAQYLIQIAQHCGILQACYLKQEDFNKLNSHQQRMVTALRDSFLINLLNRHSNKQISIPKTPDTARAVAAGSSRRPPADFAGFDFPTTSISDDEQQSTHTSSTGSIRDILSLTAAPVAASASSRAIGNKAAARTSVSDDDDESSSTTSYSQSEASSTSEEKEFRKKYRAASSHNIWGKDSDTDSDTEDDAEDINPSI